jgi:glycosyltransferase involved in cell wall biosynthesis
VDTNYFRPSTAKRHGPPNIVFTGSMDWLPNDDAMKFFIRDVLPLIKRSIPDIKLTVVGRKPYAQLLEMSKRDPSIVVTGRVDDVRPYIDQASAYVVPIRIGGGTRLKIYEAMAMEKPVVSTTVGAEGLPLMDRSEILLADTPEDLAEAVVRVVTDEKLASALVNRAAHLVREQFGWDMAAEKFKELCVQALEAKTVGSEEKIRIDQKVEAVI